jgi:hypothetical protein
MILIQSQQKACPFPDAEMEGLQLLHSLRGTTRDRKDSKDKHCEQQE